MRQGFRLPSTAGTCHGARTLMAAFVFALACRSQDQAGADSATALPGDAALNPAASPSAERYSVADFRQLRWLEGRWRGRLPDSGYFYEQYRWLNDSTIVMHAFADSTFARATDSARISLRDGVVANEGATARWVAARLDSASVDFVPARGASNSFSWVRASPNEWTAMLHSTDREGRARHTMYPMERVKRAAS